MSLGEGIEIAILVISTCLFALHSYLIFFSNKIKKSLQNKKLTKAKRLADEKKLQALTKMLMEDNTLSSKFKNYVKELEDEDNNTGIDFKQKI